MSEILSVTHGWTGPLGPFTIFADGFPVNLTGLTIALELKKWAATVWTNGAGTIVIDPDQINNTGQLTYNPTAADFVWTAGVTPKQIYQVRFRITDSYSKTVTFPNGQPDTIAVY